MGHRCVKTKCRGESSSSGRNIGGAQGGDGNVNITRPEGKLAWCMTYLYSLVKQVWPVSVVDKCVETLVEPLPENNSRSGFVEGHHAPGYQHVEWNLCILQCKKGSKLNAPAQTSVQARSSILLAIRIFRHIQNNIQNMQRQIWWLSLTCIRMVSWVVQVFCRPDLVFRQVIQFSFSVFRHSVLGNQDWLYVGQELLQPLLGPVERGWQRGSRCWLLWKTDALSPSRCSGPICTQLSFNNRLL